ncbi:MAG TPA: protocatechuate 3,4-dioxygenase subunit alpha [Gaiellales bacterium]
MSGAAGATPSQTVGPFFSFGLCVADQRHLVGPGHPGAIRIEGVVLDGAREPVFDAMVEVWQLDEHGGRGDGFGFGRCGTDAEGRYAFVTVKPGGPGAPFVAVLVFARGLLKPLRTRMYFPGEPGNDGDPLLAALAGRERESLIGVDRGGGVIGFDVHLQGDRQTAFLAL